MTSIESIINRQFLLWEKNRQESTASPEQKPLPPPIVTISRQSGSRGSYFASRLAQKLDYQRIHREIVDSICASSGYRKRIIDALDEKYHSQLDTLVDSLVTGQTVDNSDFSRHLFKVILSMSELGGVVLVGRGGSFILGPLKGFHIRVVAPYKKRIENLIAYKNITEQEAVEYIAQSDSQRGEYIRKLFGADIDDPCRYDLVINTCHLDVEELVDCTMEAIKTKMNKLSHQE
ncbi:MAG: cytidylate kinase-like family protein [bacterium]